MKPIHVKFQLNGQIKVITSMPNRTLLDVLREDFRLTGAKDACGGEGECGACTVFLNGKLVDACLVFIGQVDGCVVVSIEGISNLGELHSIQKAFIAAGAVQCGYCTPGAILSAKALLDKNPNPTEPEIREILSGNLCRCTGYTKIIDAVNNAVQLLK